jgi:peptidoglycan-N-acetylglucosamine deacetylase
MSMPSFAWPGGKSCAVSLSFDDARPSQIDAGVPILDAHGVRATFYLSPPNIAQRLEAWRRAVAAGHEMGNHTSSHPCSGNFAFARASGAVLEEYTLDRMELDIDGASEAIRSSLGVTPATFAYPCGQKFVGRGMSARSYVPLVVGRFVAGRGFRDEVPSDPSFCDLAQVNGVDGDDTPFERLKPLIDMAIRSGGWLIFACHDVGDYPRQAMRAADLDQVCGYCQDPANGVWIDTVAAIGSYIQRWR